jgi:diacylglycerol kinase (ATP)
MKSPHTGFKRILKATCHSWSGFKAAWKFEAAFRQECVMALVLIPIALMLDMLAIEKILLIMSVFVVLIVELLNSAIETMVDRLGHEFHELSGRAKDIASAAVSLSLLLMVSVWLGLLIW